MTELPEKRTTLLYLHKDDHLLLAMKKRGFGEGRYNGVGGKIEAGESIEQALVRECQEEIGVTPIMYHPVAEHRFVEGSSDNPFHMRTYVYFCHTWEGEPTETDEMAPKWHHVDTLPYDTMWSDDIYWLPHVLTGKKIHGEFTFDPDQQIIDHSILEVDILPFERS